LIGLRYDVVFLGRSLLLTNLYNPIDPRPLAANYGPDMVPQERWIDANLWVYGNARDPGATWWQWEPGRIFLRDAIVAREWPWWDPFVAAGTPAMANMVPAFFFPPYLAVVALGAPPGLLNAYFLFLIWCAGFLTFLFLRRHALGFPASLAGAVIVLMSGALQQDAGSFIGQTASCLPFVLYATRVFLDNPNARRLASLALAYSVASLASFPPLLLGIFGAVTLYVATAIALGDPRCSRVRTGMLWGGACMLAAGLVACYYVPAVLLRHAVPHVAAAYRGGGLETIEFLKILQLFSPTVFGGVQIYLNGPFTTPGGFYLPSVGAVAILTSLVARPGPSRASRTLFWMAIVGTIAALLKLTGMPPVQWIGYLPFFDQIHYASYFGSIVAFLIAFLAALGVEQISRAQVPAWKFAVVTALGIAAVVGLWVLAGPAVFKPLSMDWIRDWKVLGTIVVFSALTIGSATLARLSSGARAAAAVLVALAAAEGLYNNSFPHPMAWDVFAHPAAYMQALQDAARGQRVFAAGAPTANTNSGFGVRTLDSLMHYNPPLVLQL
jgi:hypothetical protein